MRNSLPPTSRSYRVLMIAPTSFFADYGCHVRILEEARTLQKLGHTVTIATYRNGGDVADLDIVRTLPIPWRREYEVGSSRHKLAFDALLGAKVSGLLMRRRFDVIHAHLHEGALIGLTLGRLFRIPVVFDFQGSLTEEMIDHGFLRRGGAVYGPLRRLERWIDRTSPAIFTSTVNAERILVEQFDCNPARIHALPDCVNSDAFRPVATFDAESLSALRHKFGLPADGKVIVYLGLLAEYQGTGLLLEAMQRILSRHDNVYLLLMGFPDVERYRQRAVDLGVDHRVRFTGRIPYAEAPLHQALGDAAVAPKLSLTEGAGKLINYMATGVPTVAFDTPVAREYLGPYGLFAQRGDAESLAHTLETALFDTRVNAGLGERLRERARRLYEWENAGRRIVETYAQVLGEADADVGHSAEQPSESTARGVEA